MWVIRFPHCSTLFRRGARKGSASGFGLLRDIMVGLKGLMKALGLGFRSGTMGFMFPCCGGPTGFSLVWATSNYSLFKYSYFGWTGPMQQ
jgi:hypothetical protein